MFVNTPQIFIESNLAYRRERIMADYPRSAGQWHFRWPHLPNRFRDGRPQRPAPRDPGVIAAPHHLRPAGVRTMP